jgi:hypothetical protein
MSTRDGSAVISSERLEKALTFIAQTDEEFADLKVETMRKDFICKTVRARLYLQASGTVEERKASAEIDIETIRAEEERFAVEAAYEKLKARRFREELIIECWRTESANLRKGGI